MFAFGAIVLIGGGASALAMHPSCPPGSYANSSPTKTPDGTIPSPCTSYATHVAPSSGVVLPRYVTSMDTHLARRLEVGIAALLLSVSLAGGALIRRDSRGTAAPS